jgi:glucose/arabinose dehydrogenase
MPLVACLALLAALASAEQPPPTGPETEKRFPPLQVPAGFQATLFACDPLVEYPSVISAGPRPGAVFVAADYMTGLGTDIIRRDEVRLLEDTDGDGYADRSTLCAQGFNSIQGLCWQDGALYVMHAPYLSVLRDLTGTGRPGDRRDLLTGLGLPPEQNPVRLHCANGVTWGHDGWLYLALGDNGVDVPRPEGDRLVLQGGGILRCRPDGRDLHLFATGLRNIYDVALDEDLEVFIRDNENDGGDYKIRLCHSFHGADHGYPYLYYERPEEALPPLADLGLGSSAGGVFYLERHFPAEYQGNLFFCEWGRSLVRYTPRRQGSAFAPVSEHVFASGADNDPYGFKPTDVVVQRDGSLIVSDWADGQRPRRGRGRIYHIRAIGSDTPPRRAPRLGELRQELAQLDSPSYHERCAAQAAIEKRGPEGLQAVRQAIAAKQLGLRGRLHAIWIIAHLAGPAASDDLLALLDGDPEPRIQAQAVRAIADLADPVLVRHRLDAGAGDPVLAERLARAAGDKSPSVQREVVVALGRMRWNDVPAWLARRVLDDSKKPDAALQHAALQAMRRSENWSSILKLLDGAGPARAVALRALADRYDTVVVDGLIERLRTERDRSRRREYADWLTRVHQKPGPWVYWGYRPPPRPPNRLAWERTEAIAAALDQVLSDPDRGLRLATLRRMQRERIPARLATLGQWLRDERPPEHVAAILDSLADHPGREAQPYLEAGLPAPPGLHRRQRPQSAGPVRPGPGRSRRGVAAPSRPETG